MLSSHNGLMTEEKNLSLVVGSTKQSIDNQVNIESVIGNEVKQSQEHM